MTWKNKVQIPTQAGLLKNTILLANKLGVGMSIHHTKKPLENTPHLLKTLYSKNSNLKYFSVNNYTLVLKITFLQCYEITHTINLFLKQMK